MGNNLYGPGGNCWWQCMNRELTFKSSERKPCAALGKNLKLLIPATHFSTHVACVEPNQVKQTDFWG